MLTTKGKKNNMNVKIDKQVSLNGKKMMPAQSYIMLMDTYRSQWSLRRFMFQSDAQPWDAYQFLVDILGGQEMQKN